MGINNGHTYNIGTIWNTCSSSNGLRILYLETKPIHSIYSYARTRPRLQEVGRYYYQTNRSAKVDSVRTEGIK